MIFDTYDRAVMDGAIANIGTAAELSFPCFDTCGSCGADLERSSSFPWHRVDEDCRAVRRPV